MFLKPFAFLAKKILYQLFTFTFANTVENFQVVVEAMVSSEVIQRTCRPPFGVARTEYHL
jgi:hypothetical protein